MFHRLTYDYFFAGWNGFCNHLRDTPWEDTFRVSASAAANQFCEWV